MIRRSVRTWRVNILLLSALFAACIILAVGVQAGSWRLWLPAGYDILAEEVRTAELQGQQGALATVTIFLEPGVTAADLDRAAWRELERLHGQYSDLRQLTIYMVDTRLQIPYAYDLGVAYWRPPDMAHATEPVRHGLVLDLYPRQKVTKPGTMARPSEEELRYAMVQWLIGFNLQPSDDDRAFAAEFEAGRTREALAEILTGVHTWLNY